AADRQEILDDLAAWLEAELADPGPHGERLLERSFGYDGEPPLELPVGERVLRLGGRIDRIDHGPSSFRVVDYKSGKKPTGKEARLSGGQTLQLPLYVLAGAALLGGDPGSGEAAYHGISRRSDLRRVRFSGPQLL